MAGSEKTASSSQPRTATASSSSFGTHRGGLVSVHAPRRGRAPCGASSTGGAPGRPPPVIQAVVLRAGLRGRGGGRTPGSWPCSWSRPLPSLVLVAVFKFRRTPLAALCQRSGGSLQPGPPRSTAARVSATSAVVALDDGGHSLCTGSARRLLRVQPSATMASHVGSARKTTKKATLVNQTPGCCDC